MLKRLNALCPAFPADRQKGWKHVDKNWSLAQQHEARTLVWKGLMACERAIANYPPKVSGWNYERVGNFERHAEPLAEMLHVSAIERLGCEAMTDDDGDIYRPRNLMAVFDAVCATYDFVPGLAKPVFDIRIVDWDGHDLAPFKPTERQRAVELLRSARQRLGL